MHTVYTILVFFAVLFFLFAAYSARKNRVMNLSLEYIALGLGFWALVDFISLFERT